MIIGEIVKKTAEIVTETAKQAGEAFKNIDTSKPLDFSNDSEFAKGIKTNDNRLDTSKKLDYSNDNIRMDEAYCSSYTERIACVPSEHSDKGDWKGKRGESEFIPNDQYQSLKEQLATYGMEGIEYRNADVDFSKVAVDSVKIEDMTEYRWNNRPDGKPGNFEQAYTKFSEKWNSVAKEGKTDWTARDVKEWCDNNDLHGGQRLIVHERTDKQTCDLVPEDIHKFFTHFGGCGECKRRDNKDNFGGFDE